MTQALTLNKRIKTAQHLCLLPGIFLIVSGILVLFFPAVAKVLFDINDIKTFADPIALSFGVRQLTIGLIITVIAFSNQPKALSYVMLTGAIVPLADFFIFAPSIGTISALRHIMPVPLILGLGFYLLFQLQNQSKTEGNGRA